MVEFCSACGTSLPGGDLSFRKGKMFTSPGFVCPSCKKSAGPAEGGEKPIPEPEAGKVLVFKDGKVTLK
ncbi:MAG: hypothetical protein ACYTAF_01900 [Planctomycetota bacterium]|jgi:hypothetical protein